MTRSFEDRPAVRERVPLWLGLAGPSGGGKTFSALRLATGIQRVVGGDIFVIDTESRRSLHYAELFKFRHVNFEAPFSPTDYLQAIETCVKKGAKTVVVDSCSHEHEGPGGVLDWHDQELEALGGRAADSFRAWAKPKEARRRLINSMLQMPANFILCFRAQEKVKPEKGSKELKQLGWMPIAPSNWVYECTAMALLLPGAKGVPTLSPEHQGERQMVKVPEQFLRILTDRQALNEDIGEQLARWAAGGQPSTTAKPATDHGNVRLVTGLIDEYAECADGSGFDALEARRSAMWPSLTKGEKERLKAAKDEAFARLSKEVSA